MLSYTITKAIPLHVETQLTDVVFIFYVSELQVFVDIMRYVMESAKIYNEKFRVTWILAQKADSMTCNIMEFYVEWNVGDKL